jgi:hypothetical protein
MYVSFFCANMWWLHFSLKLIFRELCFRFASNAFSFSRKAVIVTRGPYAAIGTYVCVPRVFSNTPNLLSIFIIKNSVLSDLMNFAHT